MYEASLYQSYNDLQRRDAKKVIDEFANKIQWRKDRSDKLIDIGTGSGDVLKDLIHPLLPAKYELLVGSDVSEDMLKYAIKSSADMERTKFELLNIESETIPKHLHESFDHVTSFYCLNWCQNQQQATNNIYQLLSNAGGDCLLVFLASHCIFDVYKKLAQLPKWSEVMQDYKQFITPYQYSADPTTEFREKMLKAGFVDLKIETRSQVFIYEGLQNFRRSMRSVNPFIKRLSEKLQEELIDDLTSITVSMNISESMEHTNDYRFITPYRLLVAYARKPML